MIRHYIILSSSYKMGKRIALDFPISEGSDTNDVTECIERIQRECGEDVLYSIHTIVTHTDLWQDVVDTDTFFESVKVIKSAEKFIELVKSDRVLTGLDVAKYILTKLSCTHLKLEKMVYLCYAEHLCRTKEKLFDDDICAFKYGPIVKSVYDKYKGKDASVILADKVEIPKDEEMELSIRSRILFAGNGMEKMKSIDETIEKYGQESATSLVNLTHKPDGPWELSYKGGYYDLINDDVIWEHHCVETL
ncbi:DUF4065 domain-containing protein [Anaerotruncus sp. 80]|uniref:DUF4065 domain-containing protein n=1 Tax=Anaerotruncus colihominis TaxID=169435 RepID=A0A845QJC4_9FIRM|nr:MULTISPECIES: type II toxin-antitoxin system antitoxin SocA domain-containing protein [Anaerotruncus]NBH61554.1 DUF4065 domain-containing protein [Anaerotruncus colihominis]NCF02209.1 DUF4065 domain-containing protein [Anaerotruncus sp. 80]